VTSLLEVSYAQRRLAVVVFGHALPASGCTSGQRGKPSAAATSSDGAAGAGDGGVVGAGVAAVSAAAPDGAGARGGAASATGVSSASGVWSSSPARGCVPDLRQ
jgi:hypothetical protein